jgi:hypothetical protein
MKIHPVGADLFHADRQTDRHDQINSLRKGLKRKNETTKVRVEHNIAERNKPTKRNGESYLR